jgi:hypothetical protein
VTPHHGCCDCANEPTCNCLGDCNDLGAAGSTTASGCWDCCWSTGDAIRLKATWTGTATRRETLYASLPQHGGAPQCADVTYQGGSIEVEYIVVGCSTSCPEVYAGRVKVLFALNTRFGGAVWDAGSQQYVVNGSGFTYPLKQYLALTCQQVTDGVGDGDFHWHHYNSCETPLQLPVCVTPCRTLCQDVSYEPCNGTTPRPYCSGASGLPVHGPDFYQCEHCVDAVVDCGGLKAYCLYRWVTSECAFNGNAYGQLNQSPIVCGNDCETEMVAGAFHPVETCLVAFAQTLELAPPTGSSRNCLWHEWTDGEPPVDRQCCRAAAKVPGGTDIDVPTSPTQPSLGNQSWPSTGWTYSGAGDACDCFQNPQTVTSCDPVECPDITTEVSTGVLTVCP